MVQIDEIFFGSRGKYPDGDFWGVLYFKNIQNALKWGRNYGLEDESQCVFVIL